MNKAEKWVALAAPNHDYREWPTYCYSDGTHLMATDGYRIHRTRTNKPKGYYSRKTGKPVKADPRLPWPSKKRISPLFGKGKPDRQRGKHFSTHTLKNLDKVEIRTLNCLRVNGIPFQRHFLREAANGAKTITVVTGHPEEQLYGKHELGDYLIMPVSEREPWT